ncbi:unnamed protein product [Periconia digitata]|uniref:Uncharacterized protein n=1 Tax=Periconia digitata TaxID=1303443 RepID=A0A9W4XG25_9PLEO|nr:unnamed protein product [Periconia digitata]
MQLPPETRMIVYKHCLVAPRPVDFWPFVPKDPPSNLTRKDMLKANLKAFHVNLFRVSKQVHLEAVRIVYGCNKFRFSDVGCWSVLQGFLLNLSQNQSCQYLTNIEVACPKWWHVLHSKTQLRSWGIGGPDLALTMRLLLQQLRFGPESVRPSTCV